MDIRADAPLLLCEAKNVGIRRIKALDCRPFVPRGERGNQVLPEIEQRDVAIEGGPVLLAGVHDALARRERMKRAARDEVLVVQYPVVLVRDLMADHVGVLGGIHQEEILGSVVQVSRIVHVDMIAARIPPFRFQIGHSLERERDRMRPPGLHIDHFPRRPVFESFDRLDAVRARRDFCRELTRRVKQVLAERRQPFVGIVRSVWFAIGGFRIDARRRLLPLLAVPNPNRDSSHRAAPAPGNNSDQLLLSAPALEQF